MNVLFSTRKFTGECSGSCSIDIDNTVPTDCSLKENHRKKILKICLPIWEKKCSFWGKKYEFGRKSPILRSLSQDFWQCCAQTIGLKCVRKVPWCNVSFLIGYKDTRIQGLILNRKHGYYKTYNASHQYNLHIYIYISLSWDNSVS